MQHLLDFVHEYTLEPQLYCVLGSPAGELELLWNRRTDASHWQLRPHKSDGPWEAIARERLIDTLAARGADMLRLERELHAIVSAQIALANMLLCSASELLGKDAVRDALVGHQEFARELTCTITRLTTSARPRMTVVQGGGVQSKTRAGHLMLVDG
jgi:hypothetical protein